MYARMAFLAILVLAVAGCSSYHPTYTFAEAGKTKASLKVAFVEVNGSAFVANANKGLLGLASQKASGQGDAVEYSSLYVDYYDQVVASLSEATPYKGMSRNELMASPSYGKLRDTLSSEWAAWRKSLEDSAVTTAAKGADTALQFAGAGGAPVFPDGFPKSAWVGRMVERGVVIETDSWRAFLVFRNKAANALMEFCGSQNVDAVGSIGGTFGVHRGFLAENFPFIFGSASPEMVGTVMIYNCKTKAAEFVAIGVGYNNGSDELSGGSSIAPDAKTNAALKGVIKPAAQDIAKQIKERL
jgi:hypothetical protein